MFGTEAVAEADSALAELDEEGHVVRDAASRLWSPDPHHVRPHGCEVPRGNDGVELGRRHVGGLQRHPLEERRPKPPIANSAIAATSPQQFRISALISESPDKLA